MKPDKQVYFMRPVGEAGPIKIGCSRYPEIRVREMMMWSPVTLEIILRIPGGHDLERNIHSCFVDAHDHNEWFRPTSRLLNAIIDMQRGIPVEKAIDLTARQGSIRSAVVERVWAQRRAAKNGKAA